MNQPVIISVSESVWRIEDGSVRCFLFEGTKAALLVDSGKTVTTMRDIAQGLTGKPLWLVNTHADADHIAGNSRFDRIYMSPAEYPYYFKVQKRCGPVRPLWDGGRIDIGGRQFEVIAMPGHTPGSIALLDEENRLLVGGDGIQNGSIYLYGSHRSLAAYLASLKRLWRRRSEFDTVYPSHADFPMPAGQIALLIDGVEKMLAGQIRGQAALSFGVPVRIYDLGAAKILYDADGIPGLPAQPAQSGTLWQTDRD